MSRANRKKGKAVAAAVLALLAAAAMATLNAEITGYKAASAFLTFAFLQVMCWLLFLLPLLGPLNQDRHIFGLGDGGISMLGGYILMFLYVSGTTDTVGPKPLLLLGVASSILTRVIFIGGHNRQKLLYKLRCSQDHSDSQDP